MSLRALHHAPRRLGVLLASAIVLLMVAGAAPALAEVPWWQLDGRATPTNLPPGGEGEVAVSSTNLGDAETAGAIKLTDRVPQGLTPTHVIGHLGRGVFNEFGEHGKMTCPTDAQVKEKAEKAAGEGVPTEITCEYTEGVPSYEELELVINVRVGSLSSGTTLSNEAVAEGGGAARVARTQPLRVNAQATSFGVEKIELTPEEEGGAPDTQAGSHPFQLTTTVDFNQSIVSGLTPVPHRASPQSLNDLQTNTPPGLIGSVGATARCSSYNFSSKVRSNENACAANTAIGVAEVELFLPNFGEGSVVRTVPVFNLVPAPGEPARFGIDVENVPVILDTAIETGGTYRVQVDVHHASQAAQVLGTKLVLWGEPSALSHYKSRGWECLAHLIGPPLPCPEPTKAQTEAEREPFLSLPTSCIEPLATSVLTDSWVEPGRRLSDGRIDTTDPRWKTASSSTPHLEGCAVLPFSPTIGVAPLTQEASTPTGLKVDVRVPQATTRERGGKAEAAVKSTTVALPEGMQLSPTSANGLQSCSISQIGFTGVNPATGADEFTPAPASCPDASKVASVRITSPDLPCTNTEVGSCHSEEESGQPEEHEQLIGSAYLAAPQNFAGLPPENPFESLVALYIVAESPTSHVRVKLAGKVIPNEGNGQLVSTFENTPQVPFAHFELKFFGGPRGSVSTPQLCGSYTTSASMTPWSGTPAVPAPSSFSITSGPGGGGCSSNPPPFAPGFSAGSTTTQAAAFTTFNVDLQRHDSDQALQNVTTRLPEGISGMLSSVTLCPEPQAAQGTCGAESLVGHTTATSGLGSEPFTAPTGHVFITGPYKGAPFGLTIVTPAVAGPFNLGNVIVRAQIRIDPSTAAITVISDPLPLRLRGIGLQLQHVNVSVDRPGFQFNPTNCSPKSVGATLGGAQGASTQVSYPFQATGCAALPFAPKLTATVTAQGSKVGGVGFDVKVESGGRGVANIAKVDLQLPATLPSRLTTIQKACPQQTFEANPATCGEGSLIGKAIIHTPVLRNPLSGPAYLVSHGNAAFPDVEFILQGEGVTLVLDGKTDIKNGITYSRFETNPDDPFTTFETELPAGPHSALTDFVPASRNYNLCGTTLTAPTEMTGQNGVLIRQNTPVSIIGCAKATKKLTRAQLLARALKACKKLKSKKKRAACVRAAQHKYGAKKKKGKGAARRH